MSATTALTSLRSETAGLFRRANVAPAVWVIAGISFVAHVAVGNNYGYFRDELYYMAMSLHPAFGYVDVPPLVPWITLIPRFLTGNALWALHVISALVCAATIILTGLMARLFGGSVWAQGICRARRGHQSRSGRAGLGVQLRYLRRLLVDAGRSGPHPPAAG
jgi:hypothetical protein